MTRHVGSVHEGKKPFKCEICDFRCSLKGTMKSHVESVHEGKKPFKCDICNYCCFLRHQMKQHVKKKHGGKNFDIWNNVKDSHQLMKERKLSKITSSLA